MFRTSTVRRVLALTAAVMFAAVGLAVNAAPAAADGTTLTAPFDLGEVKGLVRFSGDGHSYLVSASVRNNRPAGSVGYSADGLAINGADLVTCVTGPIHTNPDYDTVRSWSDVAACDSPYLHAVRIIKYLDGERVDDVVILNPWAN